MLICNYWTTSFIIHHLVNSYLVGHMQLKFSGSGTYKNTDYAPYRARPSSHYPWCTNRDYYSTWLAIDLGTSHSVNKIELVRKDYDTGYVLTYRVSYRNDIGESWTFYNNSQVLVYFVG